MTTDELIAIARTWLGVPFHHQGRNRAGVDCGGLLVAVGRDAGMTILEPETYSQSPDPGVIQAALSAYCVQVPVDQSRPGDVLWLTFAGEPRHVGLLTDIGLLHAWEKPAKVVEHRMDAVWRYRIRSAWRIKAL